MPGTPDPVLGSRALTLAAALLAGAVAAAVPVLRAGDRRLPPRWFLAGGVAYAAGCLAVWAVVRVVGYPAAFSSYDSASLLWFALLAAAGFAAQAVLAVYCYDRWRLVAPLVGLFAATTLVVDSFLHVGGESDPLWLFALFVTPISVGVVALAGLGEAGARRVVAGLGR